MATASGLDAQIGFVEESATGYSQGSAATPTYTAPTRFAELLSEDIHLEVERIDAKGIRAGRKLLHRWASGRQRVTGGFEVELAPQGSALLFKHLLGASTTTGANPYTHTCTPGAIDSLTTLTFQVGRPDRSGTVRPFSYSGCRILGAEISCSQGELARARFNLYGAVESTAQSLATASYPTGLSPFAWSHGSLTVAGSAMDVREATITVDNQLRTDRHFIRSSSPAVPKVAKESGMRSITGTFVAEFEDLTAYNRFVNGTEASLSLAFNAGASAQLTITGNIRFDGQTPAVSGRDMLELRLPWVAVSSTSDSAAFTVAVVNADATP